ncbi:CRISPR-associated endonuclease Cas1 [Sulfobacillus thermosulfidooxidans]|uniref:CRISPR-associated endonuclease Cas1 n=1 Tax=Sulfobacillus thermosulfidooxidans TaxID=28034 RepID=UPI00096B9F68|nr:CRISPR-associated endonuclease Cas1 [Sulfobacillus thermosulfidooxidans]OLZ11062.1 CRISPR-associated endonuclease Cas1 [Sulfobacillus thermosulfidooxidans]OLZ13481.1 CRISPR-associated endonuclease Cas1 [Sulfobacillus thermosulfidooxidans]OLZ20746.1 CRISPR-associated endonuclease Cas1 [Sulfobacillus thermosulfidooxidans]
MSSSLKQGNLCYFASQQMIHDAHHILNASAEFYKTHGDPRISYLHTTNDRRFSLHLDIAEIFKPIIVNRLIFTLIAKRMITLKDFGCVEGGIVMSEKARKTFVEGFDERL